MSAVKEKLDESVSSKINRIKSSLTQEMQMQKIICDKDNTSKEQDVNYYGEEIIEDIWCLIFFISIEINRKNIISLKNLLVRIQKIWKDVS